MYKYLDNKSAKSNTIYGNQVNNSDYKRLMKVNDIEIHFSQSGEDVVLFRLLRGKKEGFYVDVGAFHPTRYSNTALLHILYGWQGINIDASIETIKEFNKQRPRDLNIHVGVGIKNEKKRYYKFNQPAMNTFSTKNKNKQTAKEYIKNEGYDLLDIKRLDYLLDKYLPKNKMIDILNVDVEGLDLDVLRSNNWEKFRPSIVLVEDYDLFIGHKKSAINKYMTNVGYSISSHTHDTSIYVENNYVLPEADIKLHKNFLKKNTTAKHNHARSLHGSLIHSVKKHLLKKTRKTSKGRL